MLLMYHVNTEKTAGTGPMSIPENMLRLQREHMVFNGGLIVIWRDLNGDLLDFDGELMDFGDLMVI